MGNALFYIRNADAHWAVLCTATVFGGLNVLPEGNEKHKCKAVGQLMFPLTTKSFVTYNSASFHGIKGT